jgi:hypothetical protein
MTQEIKCNVNPDGSVDAVMIYKEGHCVLRFNGDKPTPLKIANKLIELGEGMKAAIDKPEK